MSGTLEQHDFCKTLVLSDIRSTLAERDLDSLYKDRDLFDIFLNGCLGWNNQSSIDCIVEYINNCCEDLNDKDDPTKFFVLDDGITYEVLVDSCGFSPFSITIYKDGIEVYND